MGLEQEAAGKAIIVYPDGRYQSWDLETPAAENKDYVFFDDLIEAESHGRSARSLPGPGQKPVTERPDR